MLKIDEALDAANCGVALSSDRVSRRHTQQGARYTNYVFRVDGLASVNAVNDVPEPSSLALFGLALIGMAGMVIARKKKSACAESRHLRSWHGSMLRLANYRLA